MNNLFLEEPYTGFGLEPEVNPLLFVECPELEDAGTRLQLTEYACFLWHWRNSDYDQDTWIGTTSHRQLEKFPFKFESKQQVQDLLDKWGVVAWGQYELFVPDNGIQGRGVPISLHRQTEICHPGLNEYMADVLQRFGYSMPAKWKGTHTGFFANYWVMRKDLFNDFMEFSWPMVEWSLQNVHGSDYYKMQTEYGTVSNQKATGYFMERLFLVWYLLKGIVPYNPSCSEPLFHNPHYA
jgi:hypothetical protein